MGTNEGTLTIRDIAISVSAFARMVGPGIRGYESVFGDTAERLNGASEAFGWYRDGFARRNISELACLP